MSVNQYRTISILSGLLGLMILICGIILLAASITVSALVEKEIQWASYFDKTFGVIIFGAIVMIVTGFFCIYMTINPTGGPIAETIYILGMAIRPSTSVTKPSSPPVKHPSGPAEISVPKEVSKPEKISVQSAKPAKKVEKEKKEVSVPKEVSIPSAKPSKKAPLSPTSSVHTAYSLFFPEMEPKVDPYIDGVTGTVDWKDDTSEKYYSENIDVTYG